MEREQLYRLPSWLVSGWILFATAYPFWPLYFGAQNTYFLTGVRRAEAGGPLSADWLAQTSDHIPVFSAWVQLTHAIGAAWLSHVLFVVLAGLYGWALYVIGASVVRGFRGRLSIPLFVLLLGIVHSWRLWEHVGYALGERGWWMRDMAGLLQSWTQGLHHHHVLRYGLLPSSFGVLLVVAIALHLRGKTRAGIVAAVAAATFHPSYILQAACVVAGLLIPALQEGRWRRLIQDALLALALVLPTVVFVAVFSFDQDPQVAEAARRILVDERFPHHARLEVLFSGHGIGQLVLVGVSLALAWRCSPLRWVLLAALVPSAAVSVAAWATDSSFLQMLMPWRILAWLVPVAFAVVLAAMIDLLRDRVVSNPRRIPPELESWIALGLTSLLLMNLAVVVGGPQQEHAPNAMVRTVQSLDCTHAHFVVDPEFYELRLNARVPVYVDRISHPYRAHEVLEWFRRLEHNNAFFESQPAAQRAEAWARLLDDAKPTHVVVQRRNRGAREALQQHALLAEEGSWALYSIGGASCHADAR